MNGQSVAAKTNARTQPLAEAAPLEKHWDLAFLGALAYLIVEYARVPATYPILGPLNLGKVSVLVCLVGWIATPKIHRAKPSEARAIDVALVALMVVVLLSTLFARYTSLAWDGFSAALRWAVIYFVLSRVVANRWRLRVFLSLYFLLLLKLALFVVRLFAEESATYGGLVPAIQGVGAGSQGFFANGSDFGVAMCVAWPIAGCLLFTKPKGFLRLLLFACVFAYLVAILVCGSRGAIVGVSVIALAALWRTPKNLAAAFMIILILLGFYFVLPSASVKRLDSATDYEQDATAHHRILLWKAGLKMFADHPFLGVGIGNFPFVRMESYPIPDMERNYIATVPHNALMDALTETGLSGFLLFLVLWISLFRLNARTRKHLLSRGLGRQSFEYSLAQGLDLALIGYLASALTQSVLWYPHVWLLLALSVGLHTTATRESAETVSGQLYQPVGMAQARPEP